MSLHKLLALAAFVSVLIPTPGAWAGKLKKTPCELFILEAQEYRNRIRVELERYLYPVREVEKAFEIAPGKLSTDVDAAIQKMKELDVRGKIFRLEALFRMNRQLDRYETEFTKWRQFIKEFEDKLGAYNDTKSSIKKAQAVNAPAEVVKHLEEETERLHQEFKTYLIEGGWVPGSKNSAYERLNKMLVEQDWPKQKTNQAEVAELLIEEIKEIRDTAFKINDLQGGVHELKRKLRWLLIEVHAHRGKITFNEKAGIPKKLRPFIYMPSGAVFPYDVSEGIKHTIELPKIYELALSNLVGKLDEAKNAGEYVERIAEAFMHSEQKLGKKEAEKAAKDLLVKANVYKDWKPIAKEAYEMMHETELLDLLIEELKRML